MSSIDDPEASSDSETIIDLTTSDDRHAPGCPRAYSTRSATSSIEDEDLVYVAAGEGIKCQHCDRVLMTKSELDQTKGTPT